MNLYPLKFKPIAKEIVWGGSRLARLLGKPFDAGKKIGESWELSGVQKSLSQVANGFLKGNNIEELVEIYMGELVGEKVYEQFGMEFPLLVKLIDATETLSVQVHPDDETAAQRHNAYGKTEMWYVLDAAPDAGVYVGFNQPLGAHSFYEHTVKNTLPEQLNFEQVQPGDVFFIPAGSIHAIGKGVMLVEIQQTSDITYRVYDWGREHNPATAREMHLDLAIDVLNYTAQHDYKTSYLLKKNNLVELVNCPYFITNLLEIDSTAGRPLLGRDSFVIYLCIEGALSVDCLGMKETLRKGETLLVPACIADIHLKPEEKAKVLEIYS
ncbi:MAG: class I mannose-6-phosphate isomerase [Prevotellaceae bacterium]|nr:class I mannose-6-phosphate isomerase [Prevotellaceae bacterium]